MKLLLNITISILLATVIINFIPIRGEESIYTNIVRLHVIAKSDSNEDQRLKLLVKDSVLEFISSELDSISEYSSACDIISEKLNEIKLVAEQTLLKNNSDDNVSISFDKEKYPIRYYDEYTLPSGIYKSLKIKIGDAEGKNWWCVLFPSVCASSAEKVEEEYIAAGFTSEQYKIINNDSGKKYKIRFKILELLSNFIGFDY